MRPSEALAAHREALRQIVSRYNVSRPRVFGSALTGKDDAGSDLDLLVDATERTTLFTLDGLQDDAKNLLGVRVSVLTPKMFAGEVSRRSFARGRAFVKYPERFED